MTDFDDALEGVLDNYATDLREAINADTEAAAQKLRKAIQAEAPVKTGKQKKSWRIAKEYLGGVDLKTVVHSTDYRKVHLLENGHVTRNGVTRTRATYYVSSNADRIIKEYEEQVAETIKVVK
ncbi:MAG: HK97 gp10 family phage protein [Ruminococcus sp.]|nr:HK97 gp10 family phage protein [Ruminococcus sp.]